MAAPIPSTVAPSGPVPSLDGVYQMLNASPQSEKDLAEESVQSQEQCEDDNVELAELMKVVAGASHGVTEQTFKEYGGIWKRFIAWVIANGWGDLVPQLDSSQPPLTTPFLIIGWIMDGCDDKDHRGQVKPQSAPRNGYGHAQKMRAAMTFRFSKIPSIGLTGWHISLDQKTGLGNPSVSHAVSSYMVSLRRRKAADGEAPTSARAITPEVMEKLYKFNHKPENWEPKPLDSAQRGTKELGSGTRRMLQAVYTVSFLCMLRSDEALNLQLKDISWRPEKLVEVNLGTRKTHQHGGVKPFPLSRLHDTEKHLCFSRAIEDWMIYADLVDDEDEEKYLFPKMTLAGQIEVRTDGKPSRLTSEQFLKAFRTNLDEIGVDFSPYGTHSFRRGGCQWLACSKRWQLRDICDWGGWSTEFSSMTIVKYLISWNDDPRHKREDFFNPKREPTLVCPMCGRSCHCS